MQKTVAMALAALFVAMVLPTTEAETISFKYDTPSGASSATCGNPACAISWNPIRCTSDDLIEDGDGLCAPIDPEHDGWVHVGVQMPSSVCGDCYTNFLVTVTDTLPASTFFNFCIITNHQDGRGSDDNFCGNIDPRDPTLTPDDIPDASAQACGSATLTAAIPSGGDENAMTGFIFATYVDESTGGICLGSSGTLTVDMS